MLGAGSRAPAGPRRRARPPRTGAAARGPASAARQLQIAVDLAYNLDHDQALAVLEQAMRDHPDDAALPRAHATLTWLNLLFRRGMVLVENYLGPVSKDDVKVAAPPTAANGAFQTQVARSIALVRGAAQAAARRSRRRCSSWAPRSACRPPGRPPSTAR